MQGLCFEYSSSLDILIRADERKKDEGKTKDPLPDLKKGHYEINPGRYALSPFGLNQEGNTLNDISKNKQESGIMQLSFIRCSIYLFFNGAIKKIDQWF